MLPVQTPITGSETPGDPTSATSGLIDFYRAFNNRDIEALARNWDRSPDIAMYNPLGGIRRGWEDISAVYRRIFGGPARVYVEFYDYVLCEHAMVMFAVGRERGYFYRGEDRVELAIRTTRIFNWSDGRWRQIHHHGSIEDPVLLEKYQKAISGR
jgi:ketosteroid isomerase-like protein